MTKIRNIIQTAASREIIKTAPDMVVYMDGFPFIVHPYIKNNQKNGPLVVNFNDYVTSISTNYGLDQLIPTGTISLSIPNGYKQLFKAPGGGLIVEPMSEIQIFAKSYFFSKNQNTLYRRVFYGLIRAVDYNETNTSLDINISIVGILHLLELTKMALTPAIGQNNTTSPVTVMKSNQSHLNPIQAIQDTFVRNLDFSDISTTTFVGGYEPIYKNKNNPLNTALQKNFADKWSAKLASLWPHTHIFGLSNSDKKTKVKKGETQQTDLATQNDKIYPTTTQLKFFGIDGSKADYLSAEVQKFHFDLEVGEVQLVQATVTSRLERLRYLVDIIGYESYQDVDGSIIIKPPLYNLDCTIVGNPDDQSPLIQDENLSSTTNPYIINISEVTNEGYAEDESAIKRTRMTVSGNIDPHGYQAQPLIGSDLTPVADFVDINLVRKFGMRDEAPKQMHFLGYSRNYNFAFAAAELAKINLGYKTYRVTIPLRPEIRVGFPIFVPHLDMYAYITGVSFSYSVGGKAETTLSCNACRKRLQFPVESTIGEGASARTILTYVSMPNLIHQWTNADTTGSMGTQVAHTPESAINVPGNAVPATVGDASTTFTYEKLPKNTLTLHSYLVDKIGNLYETAPSGIKTNWRVQNDSDNTFNGYSGNSWKPQPFPIGGDTPAGKKSTILANGFYIKSLLTKLPFTDEKGYEVISPFPWGRYSSLQDAICVMTRGGLLNKSSVGVAINNSNNFSVNAASPFLFAGLTAPNFATTTFVPPPNQDNSNSSTTRLPITPANPGQAELLQIIGQLAVSTKVSFELDYSGPNTPTTDNSQLQKQINSVLNGNSNYSLYPGSPSTTSPSAQRANDKKTSTFINGIIGAESVLATTTNYLTNMMNGGSNNSNNNISLLPQTSDLGINTPEASLSSSIGNLNQIFSSVGANLTTPLRSK